MAVVEIGKVFDKYRVLRQIGRGGMGVVYLAVDETLGREVALKVLDRAVTVDEDFERRFRQEARTVAHLNHPNIVQIHALQRLGDQLAIEMAYVEGGSLADAQAAGPVNGHQAVTWVRDVLLALACCHDQGIVHRDVKPSNILLAPDGRALLSDFGLATLLAECQTESLRSRSSSGFFMGTPRYAPPEAWDGHEAGPAWDVYSLGMVLFESVAGRTPYEATTPLALMKEMLERPVPRLADIDPQVSPELSRFVEQLLDREPEARPKDAGEALELLRNVPEASAESPAPLLGAAQNTRRRTPWKRRIGFVSARRQIGPPRPAVRRRALALIVGTMATIGMLTVFFWSTPYTAILFAPAAPQDEAAAPTPPISYGVYDTIDVADQSIWRGHWLMRTVNGSLEPRRRQWSIFARETTRIWVLDAHEGDDATLSFAGHWAEYTDASARVFRHGSVTGAGRWYDFDRQLTVSLTFESAQDGSSWERAFSLNRSAAETDVTFVRAANDADWLQPLLYNELLPRGLVWAESIETELLTALAPRIRIPVLIAGVTPPTVDGRLDESTWEDVSLNGVGEIPAIGSSSFSTLLRYDASGLYLGIRAGVPISNPRIALCLLPSFSIPMEASPRFLVQMDGHAVTSARLQRQTRTIPWDCQWQVAASSPDVPWEAEIFIPASNLQGAKALRTGDRWRMNGIVSDGPTVLVRWGAEKVTDVEAGAILVFGEFDGVEG